MITKQIIQAFCRSVKGCVEICAKKRIEKKGEKGEISLFLEEKSGKYGNVRSAEGKPGPGEKIFRKKGKTKAVVLNFVA